jgi:glycosyltransferase involved in cell wall biosynthesis
VKVGLLTTSFPRHDGDVAGHFVLGFARALSARGHHVEVLAPEPAAPPHRAQWPGIDLHHIAYLRPRALQRTFYGAGVPDNLARDPLAWLGLAPFCAQLLRHARRRALQWDALISHWALPCALAAGAVKGRSRHIAVLHSADIHLIGRLPGRAHLAARIAATADALWFVSDAQRERFVSLLPPRAALPETIVYPMGIEPPSAALDGAAREEFRRAHGLSGPCVLLLGRLVPIKGVDVALAAAAQGGMTLLIAGDGPARPALLERAAQLGVNARWLGEISGERKSRWLCAADAFALPSRQLPNGRSEGLPCALLEALAHGLPVVASKLDGVADLLEAHGLARWLVAPDDPAALRAALLAAVHEPRGPSPLSQRIADAYCVDRVGARASALLKENRGRVHGIPDAADVVRSFR